MILQVYADTSVFGGAFDAALATASQEFFNQVRNGRFRLVTSAVVQRELLMAPGPVQSLFAEMLSRAIVIGESAAADQLHLAYLAAGIVGLASATDALHVAIASVAGCNLIVSWNVRHIVHFQKIPLYNAVNTLHGYGHLAIHSPQEVIA